MFSSPNSNSSARSVHLLQIQFKFSLHSNSFSSNSLSSSSFSSNSLSSSLIYGTPSILSSNSSFCSVHLV